MWTSTFDNRNNVALAKDPTDAQVLYVNDTADRLVEFHDALGAITKYFYDGNENLTRRENVDGSVLKFDYDVLNRVTGYTDENGNLTQNRYTYAGNNLANNIVPRRTQVCTGY